jgi:hypothetical protein
VRLVGEARAAAIEAEAEALSKNQEALLAQRALEALVPMMTEFARGFDKVGSITVLGGEGASSHMAAESASSMRASFDAIQAATGIDLRQVIQGQATGRGMAQGCAKSRRSRPRADARFDSSLRSSLNDRARLPPGQRRSSTRATVASSSATGSISTPMPGAVGTRTCPSSNTIGSRTMSRA